MKLENIVILLNYLLLTTHFLLHSAEPKITANQIEFRKKENKIIFKDNVKVYQNNNFILCDYAVKDDALKVIDISGNIKAYYQLESTGTVELLTEFGKWNLNENIVKLWGNPYAVYTYTETKKLEIVSDKVEVNTELKKMTFSNNVVVNYESNKAESAKAEYFYSDKKINLIKYNSKIPTIYYYSNNYSAKSQANLITLLPESKKLQLSGDVYSEISIYK